LTYKSLYFLISHPCVLFQKLFGGIEFETQSRENTRSPK
jgi:hypothetical protein